MAKAYFCLLNSLSIGVEQATLQACGELGCCSCWCSKGQGIEGGVGLPRATARGGTWFSSSIGDSRWQGVPAAAWGLWPSHTFLKRMSLLKYPCQSSPHHFSCGDQLDISVWRNSQLCTHLIFIVSMFPCKCYAGWVKPCHSSANFVRRSAGLISTHWC